MKGNEKQRKFHETLLKMLYPPPSPPLSDKEEDEKEDDEEEAILIESLNCPPEEEIESEEPSLPSSDDDVGMGKLTRAQRKRLRKRKLKEADSCRRKIIGPLLPCSDDNIDHNRYNVEDTSNVAEGVRQNAATTNASGDQSHGSSLEVASNADEALRQNAATNDLGDEASCSSKNKLKLKQRRKSKKMVTAKSTLSSTLRFENHYR